MKKIVCLLLTLGMICLSGCSFFTQELPEEPTVNDEKPGVADNIEKEDSKEDSTEPSDPIVPDEPEEPGNSEEPTDPIEPEESVSDYITALIGTEYCSDADFLSFAINLDKRVAKRTVYVSPDGEGNGSYDDPMSLYDAMDKAKAGDTI